MLKLLVDPWLVDINLEDTLSDRYERLHAIEKLFDLARDVPINWVKFLCMESIRNFQENFINYQRPDGRTVHSLMNLLGPFYPPEENPTFQCQMPIPDLPEGWKRALCHCAVSDEAPAWRYPIVMVPDVRNAQWPPENQIIFDVGESTRFRNLVSVERYKDHIYFQPDIDPWRLNAYGEPNGDVRGSDAQRPTWKRLPRPPELPENLSLDQLRDALQGIINSTNGGGTELYFVPCPIGWNPTEHQRDPWRNCTVFSQAQVQKGPRAGRRGYLDREDRIWIWDYAEGHWDVQIENGDRHDVVSHTGRILRSP